MIQIVETNENIQEFAFAKINLALHITGLRDDGRHDIDSFVVFAKVCDKLIIQPANKIILDITGPFKTTINNKNNLALRAAQELQRYGARSHKNISGAYITLEKNLPVAAGVGGGSADAAAVLRALNRLWSFNYSFEILAKIAVKLGADVPLCLFSYPARIRGIGDKINPSPCPNFPMILVNPGTHISTASVFAKLKNKNNPPLSPLPSRTANKEKWFHWLEKSRNDLFSPARMLCPQIELVLQELNRTTCSFSQMSGSGPTCFGIYENENSARKAALYLRKKYPKWWICPTKVFNSNYACQ